MKFRVVTVCVDFSKYLITTLPHNIRHYDKIVVVTAPHDVLTQRLCEDLNVQCHVTDVFYRDGAKFNKGAAQEEGLYVLGKQGWIALIDADTVLPTEIPRMWQPDPEQLYVPYRRLRKPYDNLTVPPQKTWWKFQLRDQNHHVGYCQIFHASASCLPRNDSWLQPHIDASTTDKAFAERWPVDKRNRTPFEVLHLGEPGVYWNGVDPAEVKRMRDKNNRKRTERKRAAK